ncbi:imelysin family protein [Cribrihabitans pelagius]|uniref:imelysin family protein n=1 Tax=Cribrihabitans pelagius TaxID=1765746 RepID=UPI003B58E425
MTRILAFCLALASAPAAASELSAGITDNQILPAFAELEAGSAALAKAAEADCTAQSETLRSAYHAAYDAWIAASPYRFGPAEAENRAFALAFWPDSRGKIPRALSALIRQEDPGVTDPARFASYSIAARGFTALEYLLYDPQLSTAGSAAYRCTLVQAVSTGIAATARAINKDWTGGYADKLRTPNERYTSEAEITRELFKSLTTTLQVLADMRLGRPLGTYDAPRPLRAEARRSGRSLRHVELSLAALEPLALALAEGSQTLQSQLATSFAKPRARAAALEDPALAGVTDPASRLRIEALHQEVQDIHILALTALGPALGVAAGFNALDGD